MFFRASATVIAADSWLLTLSRSTEVQGNKTQKIVGKAKRLEFNIWNGQDGKEAVAKKFDVGAFTVANLNNDDGDKNQAGEDILDSVDTDGVVGEKDLMKLYIGGFAGEEGKVKLSVHSGSVKLWEDKEKKVEIPLQDGAVTFDIPSGNEGLKKYLWVEATAASTTVRDIELWLGKIDKKGNLKDGIDKLRATAIWATQGTFVRQQGDAIPDDFDHEQFSVPWHANPPQFIPGPYLSSKGMRFGTIMEFKIGPTGIEQEDQVKFDLARSAATRGDVHTLVNGVLVTSPLADTNIDSTWGEIPDDDSDATNEDVDPKNLHIYDIDIPALIFEVGALQALPIQQAEYKGNFLTWVRVSFDGQRPDAPKSGARCSPQIKWHIHGKAGFDLIDGKRVWKWDPNVVPTVAPGHMTLPALPPAQP